MLNSAEADGRRPVAGTSQRTGIPGNEQRPLRERRRVERRVGHADVPDAIRVQQAVPRRTGKVPSERESVTSCDNTG